MVSISRLVTLSVLSLSLSGCASFSYDTKKRDVYVSEQRVNQNTTLAERVGDISDFLNTGLKTAERKADRKLNDNVASYLPWNPRLGRVDKNGDRTKYGVQWDVKW